MDEISLNDNQSNPQQQSVSLISTPEEIEDLASELADEYVDYLLVETAEQRQRVEDSTEECLAHLEEVSSILDVYRQRSITIPQIVDSVVNRAASLEQVYRQVDAIEQYMSGTNRLLDQLEQVMDELESRAKPNGYGINQLVDLLPRVSLRSLQRINIFNGFRGIIEESGPSFLDEGTNNSEQSSVPISEILNKVSNIETAIGAATVALDIGLFGQPRDTPTPATSPILVPDQTGEQVDGSWQELL